MSRAIRILPDPLFEETLPPFLYGDFIEFLNDLLPGMWAEKIQDRSFEGVPQPGLVYPPAMDWSYPRWKPLVVGTPRFTSLPTSSRDVDAPTGEAHLDYDEGNPFVGTRSARICVAGIGEGNALGGIVQGNVAVRASETLRVELFARAESGSGSLRVLIGRNYGVFFRAYAECVFSGVSDEWNRFAAELTPDATDDDAEFFVGTDAPGVFFLDKISLMPVENLDGWRPDVVAAIRAMKPGIIRFGGSSLIYYDWETGIGPCERRETFINEPWGNREEHDVGLHEFLRFCELVEAEPLLCLNSNAATIGQILAEIEYCNGAAESPYGRLRAEMGHPEPFRVRYWQIGNEQSGDEYERRMVEVARAIRAAHPDLILLASYPSENILTNLSDTVDYVCPHFYEPYTPRAEQAMRDWIDAIRTRAKNKNLKLGLTEWNHTAGHWGWARAWLLTLFNALNAARMFHMFHRLGDSIRIANRSNMTNSCNSGVLQTNRSDLYVTPTYHVQKAYANFSGETVLRIDAPDDALDISATRRANGEIAVFVVNPYETAKSRTVDFEAIGGLNRTANVWTLTGPTLESVNSFREKTRVAPTESTVEWNGHALDIEFPRFSVTILRARP